MRFTRRRSDRPVLAQLRAGSNLEVLEKRELMVAQSSFHFYVPTDLPAAQTPLDRAGVSIFHPLSTSQRQLSFLDNDGKILTGTDRQGDQWTIQVHGPGVAIVTDTTPNDGVLDDTLDTIQLLGTNINTTYVTGTVTASPRLVTSGTITFNHLIAPDGVNSISLNGFTLAQTVTPPPGVTTDTEPAIFLPGGVRFLEIHDIQASTDLSLPSGPINIIIGNPTTPLTVQPVLRVDSIFNTVFDSRLATNPPVPQTQPTVNVWVNGQLHSLDAVSATAAPIPAAFQFKFPTVGITGRTAIRAVGIDNLKFVGATRNLTVSRRQTPFDTGLSGLDHLGTAQFGGNADAVGLDVAGPIGKLAFLRGLGNPTGLNKVPTTFGTPTAEFGYPAFGFLGGLVTSTRIGKLFVGPAEFTRQTNQNPEQIQLHRQGNTLYFTRPGNALTHAVIASSGSIGHTQIVGNLQTSEIKSGFHYPSFFAGLEGTRAPSQIAPIRQQGDLIDSVVTATVRPFFQNYNLGYARLGPGKERGHFQGVLANTGAITALDNIGVGYLARKKVGYLPPPERPKRFQSVLFNT